MRAGDQSDNEILEYFEIDSRFGAVGRCKCLDPAFGRYDVVHEDIGGKFTVQWPVGAKRVEPLLQSGEARRMVR